MASINTIDIMGSLDAALSAITGSKINLSLSTNLPFAGSQQKIEDNENLIKKMKEQLVLDQEKERLRAVAVQQAASGGAGTNIRAPARIRNRI